MSRCPAPQFRRGIATRWCRPVKKLSISLRAWAIAFPRDRKSKRITTTSPRSTSHRTIQRGTCKIPFISRPNRSSRQTLPRRSKAGFGISDCCEPTPPPCRSATWRPIPLRCGWWPPGACSGGIPWTPPTHRCSTRWKCSPWTRVSTSATCAAP